MSWTTMRLPELNFVWLQKDQVFFPQRAPQIIKKADPSWTLLFSEKVIKTTWKCWHFKRQVCILMTSTSTRNVCGHWTWSRDMKQLCWRESDPSFFNLWTVQRQKKSSVVVFPYAVPSFIIYSSNLLSMQIQAHGCHTLFIVGFLICLNEGFSTIINV